MSSAVVSQLLLQTVTEDQLVQLIGSLQPLMTTNADDTVSAARLALQERIDAAAASSAASAAASAFLAAAPIESVDVTALPDAAVAPAPVAASTATRSSVSPIIIGSAAGGVCVMLASIAIAVAVGRSRSKRPSTLTAQLATEAHAPASAIPAVALPAAAADDEAASSDCQLPHLSSALASVPEDASLSMEDGHGDHVAATPAAAAVGIEHVRPQLECDEDDGSSDGSLPPAADRRLSVPTSSSSRPGSYSIIRITSPIRSPAARGAIIGHAPVAMILAPNELLHRYGLTPAVPAATADTVDAISNAPIVAALSSAAASLMSPPAAAAAAAGGASARGCGPLSTPDRKLGRRSQARRMSNMHIIDAASAVEGAGTNQAQASGGDPVCSHAAAAVLKSPGTRGGGAASKASPGHIIISGAAGISWPMQDGPLVALASPDRGSMHMLTQHTTDGRASHAFRARTVGARSSRPA